MLLLSVTRQLARLFCFPVGSFDPVFGSENQVQCNYDNLVVQETN